MLSSILAYMRYRETKKQRQATDALVAAQRETGSVGYVPLSDVGGAGAALTARPVAPQGVVPGRRVRWYHTDYPSFWQVAVVLPLGCALAGEWAAALVVGSFAAFYLFPVGRTVARLLVVAALCWWLVQAVGGLGQAVFGPMGAP